MRSLFLALFLLIAPAAAQANCISMDRVLQIAEVQKDRVQELEAASARVAIDIFQAQTGMDARAADSALLIHRPDGTGIIAVGLAGYFCGFLGVPAQYWPAVKRGILGHDA